MREGHKRGGDVITRIGFGAALVFFMEHYFIDFLRHCFDVIDNKLVQIRIVIASPNFECGA